MAFVYRVSTKPLSACVDYLWLADGYAQPYAHEVVLPSASMTLVVDLDDQRADMVRIHGAPDPPTRRPALFRRPPTALVKCA